MTPAYTFTMPRQLIEPMPMPRPMPPPPPRNYDIGGKVRDPEPEDGEDLTDLMQYYQPQPPMYVSPMGTVNPVPSMFGGVTMPPGPASGYVPPIMVGPGQQPPMITSGQGTGPDPRYRLYTPPPFTPSPVSPPPPPRPALIEPMPMPRPMPPPPPRNYDIGGRIRSEEPEPEGNAFFTI